ncbi:MAG: ribonuclease P protein component 1 [Methanocellales archaeon]
MMPITPENLIHHELIGLKIEVLESSNPSLKGLKGRVIYETKKTLVIENGRTRRIPKQNTIFIFQLPNQQKVKVDGNLLLASPEDRIGRRIKVR